LVRKQKFEATVSRLCLFRQMLALFTLVKDNSYQPANVLFSISTNRFTYSNNYQHFLPHFLNTELNMEKNTEKITELGGQFRNLMPKSLEFYT